MLYRISVTERGLTGIANIFRSRLSRLDDLLGAGTVPLNTVLCNPIQHLSLGWPDAASYVPNRPCISTCGIVDTYLCRTYMHVGKDTYYI